MHQAAARWLHFGLSTALAGWRQAAQQQAAKKGLVARALGHWRLRLAAAAFLQWQQRVEERQRLAQVGCCCCCCSLLLLLLLLLAAAAAAAAAAPCCCCCCSCCCSLPGCRCQGAAAGWSWLPLPPLALRVRHRLGATWLTVQRQRLRSSSWPSGPQPHKPRAPSAAS
jgi:hypothetical protein